ncbi:hypothetical protein FYZ48_07075 [Gimesia chilikensis]|uniref:hypothetical protein n=1 Tax=Gimesia chilikensis TaxID=2605989 RepID=UPI0011EF0471|nr:hypothetical protein [Gimesia chilikensis]KAA0141028.1 hypothetical protein FYZ48_07075 [Gimesia chilikensis]
MAKGNNYHLRDLPSVPYHLHEIPPEFTCFMDEFVLPRLGNTGYKIAQKNEIATQAIHQLILTGLTGKVVSDTRRKDQPGVRLRIAVWDKIVNAGLAKDCLGSEEAGRRTRYCATSELLELRQEWELRLLLKLDLVRNSERPHNPKPLALIYLHTGKIDLSTGKLLPVDRQKQPLQFLSTIENRAQLGSDGRPDPQAIKNGLEFWRAMEDRIEYINRSNLQHSWQAFAIDPESGREFVFQPNPCVRQIHLGHFFRAARLYSWGEISGQNLSKSTRRTMLIDGESVAELDFSGMATRMLYHLKRIDPKGDVYHPEKVMPRFYGLKNFEETGRATVRDFIKRATNICWNVTSRPKAHSAISKLLTEHPEHDFLHEVVFKIEKLRAPELVNRLMAVHADLADRFFTGCGIDLMTEDGRIMLHILEAFARSAKPALGIHDSIVCKLSDVDFAEATMSDMYYKFLQYKPVIKRVF